MKTRLLYLSKDKTSQDKFNSFDSECLTFYANDRNKGMKYLKSRYPSIVILNDKLLNDWGKEVLEYIGSDNKSIDLVIEFENITKGTLLNLVNNFSISKLIDINSRDYLNNIGDIIKRSAIGENKDKTIKDLRNRIEQYDYILQQNLIES